MGIKTMSLVIRSSVILVMTLGSQQILFGHHAEVMRGNPLLQGLSMPLHGLDHMLIAVGVGVIAAQLGGRASWVVPLSFATVLLMGGFLNLSGISIPLIDQMVFASLILASAQLIVRHHLPAWIMMVLFPLFGAVHGQAMIQVLLVENSLMNLLLFASGCMFAVLLLLSLGWGIGFLLKKMSQEEKLFPVAGVTLLVGTFLVVLVPEANNWLVRIFERL